MDSLTVECVASCKGDEDRVVLKDGHGPDTVFLTVFERDERCIIQLNEESARQIHNWLKTKYKG